MKKIITALLVLLLFAQAAAAQADMQLYVAENTISRAQASRLSRLLHNALGETVTLVMQEEAGDSLEALILADRAPQLAIVSPQQALPWAKEGLLLELEGCVEDVDRIAMQVIDACVYDEQLVIAPLLARHRRMAVNAGRMNDVRMGYLLDERAHPVWYPSETVQVLDEFTLEGAPGMEIWPVGPEGAPAIEALLQGVIGIRLADEMTGEYAADEDGLEDALGWLGDMTHAGLIGVAQSRQEALERFLAGETAIFLDWTDEEAKAYAKQVEEMEIFTVSYPNTTGMPLHAYDLIGVCAMDRWDAEENALLRRAVSALTESAQAQLILGDRGIRRDGADWLPVLSALDYGATLRRLLGAAVNDVMKDSAQAQAAAQEISRAMEALAK